MAKYISVASVRIDWISENIGFNCAVWSRKFGSRIAVKTLLAAFWDNNKKDWAFLLLDCLLHKTEIGNAWNLACANICKKYGVNQGVKPLEAKEIATYQHEMRKSDELALETYSAQNGI